VKDNISALETKINAGQGELRQEINAFQDRIRNIEAGQAQFEERVTRKLREDLNRIIEAGQAELEERVTCAVDTRLENATSVVEATRQDFETRLTALEARPRRAGCSNAGANTDKVKPPKFDGSTSWVVFQRQFEAAVIHNDWTPKEKDAHLLSVLQGQAAHVLHSAQPKHRTRTSLGRCESDSETTSWRRLTDHTLKPGCRRVVRHCKSS
jgi:hypothetical protein